MTERTWYIKQCPLFEQLSTDQLTHLENNARVRTFPKNVNVYPPSDASETVFVLLRGRVRICTYTHEGKQAILAFIEPGEMFGELSLTHSEGYEDHAETMLPSTVALIPKANFERLLADNPPFSMGITKIISWRLLRIERRLRSLLFRSNRDRVVQLMLDLVEQYGSRVEGGTLIDIRLSHQDLANLIGCTRESVTMVLGELQSQRYLKIGRQRIVIVDPRKLADDMGFVDFRQRSSNSLSDRSMLNFGKPSTWKPNDSLES